MKYGDLPHNLGVQEVICQEMMFYQYLPIKLINGLTPIYEKRLECFNDIVGKICCDFIGTYGLNEYINSNIYLTAKYMYQSPGCSFNREGYHADGFLTDDVNYIWSDKFPTIFNTSNFNISLNDQISCKEMEEQTLQENEFVFKEKSLVRLNQYNIHKVAPIDSGSMRTFLKLSFSKDKYDLIGNSKNDLLNYNWIMRERKESRNVPQML